MQTDHRIFFASAAHMEALADESIDLVVTSPPYPMIEMWDACFCRQDPSICDLLTQGDGPTAWERMHRCLDPVWKELYRVLVPGGLACINIGDATRTVEGHFRLYANHTRIQAAGLKLGFTSLPLILWRKQTNAPNKFMGSGMLPAGAYVTLEHEYILVLRKGEKREFNADQDKAVRRRSAYFWEERNQWFSDVWFDIKGSRQSLGNPQMRARSGAFPLELALRLILMFSVQGDRILDPFMGTGTTLQAAMATGRSSVGYELESTLMPLILNDPGAVCELANDLIDRRLSDHRDFVKARLATGKAMKHTNANYDFPVVTRQEKELHLPRPVEIQAEGKCRWRVTYTFQSEAEKETLGTEPQPAPTPDQRRRPRQRELFA
jgi:modification methylase